MGEIKLAQKSQVIWRQGFKQELCADIPFIGRQCVSASAEVRVLEEGGTYYLEIEVLGYTERYNLADACFPAVSYGLASVKVCVKNPDISGGVLKSFSITAELCIGAKLLGQNLEQCWDVLNTRIVVAKAAHSELYGLFQPLETAKFLDVGVNIPINIGPIVIL